MRYLLTLLLFPWLTLAQVSPQVVADWQMAAQVVASASDPSSINNLVVWLKPESLSGNDWDVVSQWNDSSGNSNHAISNGVAAATVYVTNISSLSLAGALSTNTSCVLVITNLHARDAWRNSGELTSFCVYLRNANNSSRTFYNVLNGVGSSRIQSATAGTTTFNVVGRTTDGGSFYTSDAGPIPSGLFSLSTVAKLQAQTVYGLTNAVLTKAFEDTTFGDGNNWSDTRSTAVIIGNASSGGTASIIGTMLELIMYNRALTDDEITTVHTYLKTKYGI